MSQLGRQDNYGCGLPSTHKAIIDETQIQRTIYYKQKGEVITVRKIIDLVAIDPPICVVSRLISSFDKVTGCCRKSPEDVGTFVARFRGLAAEHLIHAGLASTSQMGEVLAIAMRKNPNLSEETLTITKTSMLNHGMNVRKAQGERICLYRGQKVQRYL